MSSKALMFSVKASLFEGQRLGLKESFFGGYFCLCFSEWSWKINILVPCWYNSVEGRCIGRSVFGRSFWLVVKRSSCLSKVYCTLMWKKMVILTLNVFGFFFKCIIYKEILFFSGGAVCWKVGRQKSFLIIFWIFWIFNINRTLLQWFEELCQKKELLKWHFQLFSLSNYD